MRKIILLLAVLFTATFADQALAFSDTKQKDIQELVDLGIIDKSTGAFNPSNSITRREVVVMIARELGVENYKGNSSFKDVPAGSNGYKEISAISDLGYINGFTDGNFKPNDKITRAQMAKILVTSYGMAGEYKGFIDVKSDHWAASSISALAANGITVGYKDGTFKPNGLVTKQEFSMFLARYIRATDGGTKVPPLIDDNGPRPGEQHPKPPTGKPVKPPISLDDRKIRATDIESLYTHVQPKTVSNLKFSNESDRRNTRYDMEGSTFTGFENVCTIAPDINVYFTSDTYNGSYKYSINHICGIIGQIEEVLNHELETGLDYFIVKKGDPNIKGNFAAFNLRNGDRSRIFHDVTTEPFDYRLTMAHEIVHSFEYEMQGQDVPFDLELKLGHVPGSQGGRYHFYMEGVADFVAKNLIIYSDEPDAPIMIDQGLTNDQLIDRIQSVWKWQKPINWNNIDEFADIGFETDENYFFAEFVWRMFEDNYGSYHKGLNLIKDVNLLDSYNIKEINKLYVKHFGKTEKELVEEWKNYVDYKRYK